MLRVKDQAGVAADAGISLSHHNSFDLGIKTAAVLQLMASTPSVNLPPDRTNFTLVDDVIEKRHTVADGSLSVPDGPGLGVTVDEEKVQEYRLD
jgi:L-alanine-DL-glutamate epimerase-like enolase superfamily enzyme